MTTHMKARGLLNVAMAESEFLKIWYSVNSTGIEIAGCSELDASPPGTLKWHRQPVLSILRGISSGSNQLNVNQEFMRSHNRSRSSLEYRVSRGGFRIGIVNVEVGLHSVVVRAYSVHPSLFDGLGSYDGPDPILPVVKWNWNDRAFERSRSRNGRKIWSVPPVLRPKFRRLGTRIRKVLLELDNGACIERVMNS